MQDQTKASLIQESKKVEIIYNSRGIDAIKKYITAHRQYKGEDHRYYLLINKKGKTEAGDLKKWPLDLESNENVMNIWVAKKDIVGSVKDGDGYWPMITLSFRNGSKMLIAQGISGTEDLRETMFTVMALIFAIIVILIIALGLSLGKSVLWHIDNINLAHQAIMNGNLSVRIKISDRNDEFDMIAEQLNEVLDKVEQLIIEAKQVTNNIAHDLRSPLSRIRNRLEISLINKSGYDYGEILEKTIGDMDNIIKTFNSILEIAQAESEAARKSWKNINISDITLDAAEIYRPLAEDKSIEFDVHITNGMTIKGNKHLIAQSIGNIIDNAIKYTPEKGTIDIYAKENEESVEVSVSDSGPGVNSKDYKNITKRFVRLDVSRHTPGNGLGLSLVEAVAKLHNASLIFEDNKPGLRVKLVFRKLKSYMNNTPSS